jgi:TOM7 family
MPVPRRRNKALVKSPTDVLKIFDIDFLFQKTKTLLYYGFAPAVVFIGMYREPGPASWFELINIF